MSGYDFTPPIFSNMLVVEPRLPADLERTIFELAVHNDRRAALDIILVAHRCRSWIEPILYRRVVICQSSWGLPLLLRTLESKPAHFAALVKAIKIDAYRTLNSPAVSRILSLCTNAVHLVDLSYGRTPLAVLSRLRLERMCISIDAISGLPADSSYFRLAAFSRLTHLQIFDPSKAWACIPFTDLPSLTHLALHNYVAKIRPANILVLRNISTSCPLLEVLVVCIPFCRPEDRNEAVRVLVDVPKIVVLSRAHGLSYDLWSQPLQETAYVSPHHQRNDETVSRNPWQTNPTRRRRKTRTREFGSKEGMFVI